MEPFEIEPGAMIQAQQQRIVQLTNENVQLMAAVTQLQQQVAASNGQVELDPEAEDWIKDVTDEVVGAEITS